MTVSTKLADFAPWYSRNQQFSSSCCSTRVISGPCFWELKQWQRLRSALQRAVGAGLDRWSTGWCLVWHSTWTTLHATARGRGYCQHAQSVVTVPFAPSASVMLHVQFVSSLSSFTNSHFHQNSFVHLSHLIYIQEMIHYHHRIVYDTNFTSNVVQWPVNIRSRVSKSSLWGPPSRFSGLAGRKWLLTRWEPKCRSW